jgi:hypothetical protein
MIGFCNRDGVYLSLGDSSPLYSQHNMYCKEDQQLHVPAVKQTQPFCKILLINIYYVNRYMFFGYTGSHHWAVQKKIKSVAIQLQNVVKISNLKMNSYTKSVKIVL